MTPQTVNAVNLPLQNALNFPAAILQPPFFDPEAPAAVNYGAIGSVIGHEISHTFDAEGSAFDSKGRVRNWWTPEDHAHFEQQAEKLEKQYDAYEPFPGVHVNGKQTIDENIADLGGIAAAYDGYRASLHGAEAPRTGWLHRRSAVLHRLRPELGLQIPRGRAPPPGPHRRAFARRSTALTPSATPTPGTRPSTSSPAKPSTSRPTTAFASGRSSSDPVVAAARHKKPRVACARRPPFRILSIYRIAHEIFIARPRSQALRPRRRSFSSFAALPCLPLTAQSDKMPPGLPPHCAATGQTAGPR